MEAESSLVLNFNPAVRDLPTHLHVPLQIAGSSKCIFALAAFDNALMGALICEPLFVGPTELPY